MPRTLRSRAVQVALVLSVLTVAACAGRGAIRDEGSAPPAATAGVPGGSVDVASASPSPATVAGPAAIPSPPPTPDLSAIDLAGIDALIEDLTRSLADDATSATEVGSPE